MTTIIDYAMPMMRIEKLLKDMHNDSHTIRAVVIRNLIREKHVGELKVEEEQSQETIVRHIKYHITLCCKTDFRLVI